DHQIRRVELVRAEGLDERSACRVDTLVLDELADLVPRGAPSWVALAPVQLRKLHEPVERDPRHHLRVDEVPRLAADLPDSLVRVSPALEHDPADPREEVPEDLVDFAAVLPVEPGRVEQLAERVELELLCGAVPDSHRPRAAVPLEPVELDRGEQPL